MIFNSGKSKIDEYAIEFDEEGVYYHHMSNVDSLSWSQYLKYEIKGVLEKTLTIYGKDKKISFSLPLFDPGQQKTIISELNRKS
jgi:hypothetical protein